MTEQSLETLLKESVIKNPTYASLDWGYLPLDEHEVLDQSIVKTLEVLKTTDDKFAVFVFASALTITNIMLFIEKHKNAELTNTIAKLMSKK